MHVLIFEKLNLVLENKMKFKCKFCEYVGEIGLSDKEMLAFKWYKDESNFNHTGIACTKCGTLHDCIINMLKIPLSILRIANPYKIIRDITPIDLGLFIKDLVDEYSINCREAALYELQINEYIIDKLTSLDLIGKCYADPVTMTYADFRKEKDNKIARDLVNNIDAYT